jgi:hypothetical protein
LETKDYDDPEDNASLASMIRDQIERTLKASSPSERNDREEEDDTSKDNSTSALEEYLASRMHQVGEVAPERKEIGGLRTGNGWDANQVVENVFKIEPIPVKRALEIALSANRTFKERLRNTFRGRRAGPRIVGTPTVEFVPIWKLKGFHECYYLRTSTYRINVKNDVVGVEVEGRSRDLMLEKKHRHFIPAAIIERFQMLGTFLTNESKYFVVSDVLELATKKSASELTITGLGRIVDRDDELALTSWKSKRIFDPSDLAVHGTTARVRESILTKEGVLNRFREQVVRMPERFKQILSNRLQVIEMKRIYIPLIRISVQKGLVPIEIVVNGASGELADNELLGLLE